MGQYFPWVYSIGTIKTLSVEVGDPSDSQLTELLAVAFVCCYTAARYLSARVLLWFASTLCSGKHFILYYTVNVCTV